MNYSECETYKRYRKMKDKQHDPNRPLGIACGGNNNSFLGFLKGTNINCQECEFRY